MAERFARQITFYIWSSFIPALVVLVVAAALAPYPSSAQGWLVYPIFIIIGWLAEEYRVHTRSNTSYNLTAVVHLPLMLLFTPLEATSLAAVSSIISFSRRRRPLPRIAYNAVVRIISVGIPSIVLTLWRAYDPRFHGQKTFLTLNVLKGIVVQRGVVSHLASGPYLVFSLELIAGCAIAMVLYVVIDSALISTIVAVQRFTSPVATWQANMRAVMLLELTKSVIGIIAACMYLINPLFAVFMLLPIAVTHAMTRAMFRLERETIDAVTALADAIDYRDPYTAQHSVRVADISRRLAQRLGLSREQVDEITLAARVHDLGKIGIPNDILLKNGKLTADEMATMQTHPRIGAEVLEKYGNFHRALPIVLHHHERYDGKGYPDGLKGDEIPVGAQIVAHADAFDAMVSDRPYRKGLRPEMALQRVSEATGSQFNPVVAGAFVAMVREDLIAAGLILPETGGSLAETAVIRSTAGGEDKVRYLYGK